MCTVQPSRMPLAHFPSRIRPARRSAILMIFREITNVAADFCFKVRRYRYSTDTESSKVENFSDWKAFYFATPASATGISEKFTTFSNVYCVTIYVVNDSWVISTRFQLFFLIWGCIYAYLSSVQTMKDRTVKELITDSNFSCFR